MSESSLKEWSRKKANKSLKAVLKKSVDSLEQQCHKMKEQLFEIKEEVRGKASEIVEEVKQKGKKALNKVSEFLGIKEKLQNSEIMCRNLLPMLSRALKRLMHWAQV